MMYHMFSIEIAGKYGVECAVILHNLHFWIEKNRANNHNHHNGNYWTYNSVRAWQLLFPYLSAKMIRNALKKLEDHGIIESGNYNTSAYDRTKWYALTQKGISICPKVQINFDQKANQFNQKDEPIPDNKPIINSNKKPNSNVSCQDATKVAPAIASDVLLVFEFWKATMNITKAVLDKKRQSAIARALVNYSVDDLKLAVQGCYKSDFHMGRDIKNNNAKKYNDIELICRDTTRIEGFIDQTKHFTGTHRCNSKEYSEDF